MASIAGVAKSTVSRYLNGGYVSEQTGKKICKAIRDTNYVPNNFAQSLKAKKNNLIGIIVPRLDSYANSRTLAGIDERLRELGYQLIISCTGQKVKREIESIENLINQRISGIILISGKISDKHKKALGESDIPVILLGQKNDDFYCVMHNDEDAGYQMGSYIIDKGHRNICYVDVDKKDVSAWSRRKLGFQKCMRDNNIDSVSFFESDSTIEGAIKIEKKILTTQKPTIIACATDNIAIGIIKGLIKRGISIPKDISVIGIGDYEVARMVTPSLTTIHYPYKSCGKLLAEKIVDLITGNDVEHDTIIPVKLVERESVSIISKGF
ncbi:LacI family DNA-binding transcriptional regulator [Clostridium pasteurianum]|uniref:LacI family DNA-binding transcriptional regulator n=1 Tax=Clostridium pasteurianum TaxID=1501 RepID=UPI003D6E8E0D